MADDGTALAAAAVVLATYSALTSGGVTIAQLRQAPRTDLELGTQLRANERSLALVAVTAGAAAAVVAHAWWPLLLAVVAVAASVAAHEYALACPPARDPSTEGAE